ncbi:MAG: hypothetical protein ACRDSJ_22235 [Rubrobacteraceae bacterium]
MEESEKTTEASTRIHREFVGRGGESIREKIVERFSTPLFLYLLHSSLIK